MPPPPSQGFPNPACFPPPPEGGSYYCGGYSVHCRADLGPEATLLSPLSFSRPPCRRNHTFSEVPVSAGSEAAWLRKRRDSVTAGAAKASASTPSAWAEVILDEGHAQDRDLLKSRCLQNQGRAPEFPSRANRAGNSSCSVFRSGGSHVSVCWSGLRGA